MRNKVYIIVVLLTLLATGCSQIAAPEETAAPTIAAITPPPTATPSPTARMETTVTLAAVGDNLIHSPIYKQARERSNDGYDFSPVYERIENEIRSRDISIINQETPLGGTSLGLSSYPLFNSPHELGDALIDLGFDIVNHANNHVLDAGQAGAQNTLSYWKSKDIPVVGLYKKDESPIRYINKNGLSLAFVAFTYGTNGMRLPSGADIAVSYLDKSFFEEQIKTARSSADIVVVSVHWGDENSMEPNDEQREYAQLAASLNTDLLIGHHPHVLQPIETLPRADGRDMLVAYSLGNFVSCQNDAENMASGILTAEFKGSRGDARLVQANFIPLITQYGARYANVHILPFEDYSETLAATHGCRAFDSRFSFGYIRRLFHSVIAEEYLAQGKQFVQ